MNEEQRKIVTKNLLGMEEIIRKIQQVESTLMLMAASELISEDGVADAIHLASVNLYEALQELLPSYDEMLDAALIKNGSDN